MLLLLGGVLEELRSHRSRVDPLGGVVMAFVAENADDLGRKNLVEHGDHPLAICTVGVRDGTKLQVLPRALAQGLDVGQELGHPSLPWIDRIEPGGIYPESRARPATIQIRKVGPCPAGSR